MEAVFSGGPAKERESSTSESSSERLFCHTTLPCRVFPAWAEIVFASLPSTIIEEAIKGCFTVSVIGWERNGTRVLVLVSSASDPIKKRRSRSSPSEASTVPVIVMVLVEPGFMVPSRHKSPPTSAWGEDPINEKPKGYCPSTTTCSTGVAAFDCTVTVIENGSQAIASLGASTERETGEDPIINSTSPSLTKTALEPVIVYSSVTCTFCAAPSCPKNTAEVVCLICCPLSMVPIE